MIMDVLVWTAYVITLFIAVYWVLLYLGTNEEHRKPLKKKNPKTWPGVAVVIPAYNEENSIEKTIESVLALDYPKNKLRIIIVNDGSKDNTEKIATTYAKKHKNITYLYQENQGKAAALNNALTIIKEPHFACLDADSEVDPRAAKEMVRAFTADKELQICTPVLRVGKPKTWIQKFQRIEYLAGMLLIRMMSNLEGNYVAPGPFSMYRTSTIKKLGGFDLHNLVEDQEIAYRVQEHHGKIRQVETAPVDTIAPHSFKQLRKQRNRWMKGTLLNLIKYKHLLFNKKYGDFGSLIMPVNILTFVLAFIALIAFAYYIIKPVFELFKELWIIQFDIIPYLDDLKITFNILDINLSSLFIIWLLLLLSVFLLFVAARFYQDSIFRYGSVYIIPYFFVYFLLLAIVAVQVIIEVLLGRKQTW